MTKEWKIKWYTEYADATDVEHAQKEGKSLKVGDAMWRMAKAIGPLEINHNHWAGDYLDCTEEEAALTAAAPDLLAACERLLMSADASWRERDVGHDWDMACEAAIAAIAKAKSHEK